MGNAMNAPKTVDGKNPESTPILIDKVRASKAGHAFHEAWAARSALELLLPSTDLSSIALEGFTERDEQDLGTDAVEIADLVRYHGANDVARAHAVTIVQFKYSISYADKSVRAADLAHTLTKFAKTDAELIKIHGHEHVSKVVRYEFATNRPIHDNLVAALSGLLKQEEMEVDINHQADQIAKALEDYPFPPSGLLLRLNLVGSKGTLIESERTISATLAAWSEPSDPDAEKRLLKLRNLVRIKAGPGSEKDKRIDRVAVLAELGVEHESLLYPTPDAFPPVGEVVHRAALDEIATLAREPGLPLVIHAAGGMGKTVLMQSVAEHLRSDGPVVVFDGFGAGRWRDPADGRHLPERTLVHLSNLLAGQGLCDILLPIADQTALLKAFRRRLNQAVEAARKTRADANLTLVLDAIDHAGLAAAEGATPSFAHLLLRSVSAAPIDGVRIVASCRTERLEIATGNSSYRSFPVPSFTDTEARNLIFRRVPDASAAETAALLVRSGRNPRCLDNLMEEGRPFDPIGSPESSGEPQVLLDDLLRKRLARARDTAIERGAKGADVDLLLTGIALLVPPVPILELAATHGMLDDQVESFATDLAPLLERTTHGLMFRDEPTETLIRNTYGENQTGREHIVAALLDRQSTSHYAARALPALLMMLRDGDQLTQLAFDPRVPKGTSQVSLRDIRMARIIAAINLAAETTRRDDLLRLLVEASLVAAGHERSDRLLYEHPDLVAVSNDPEALRRLAACNVGWPGGKHAALALASVFAGDQGEARRHARRSIDWHNWAIQPKHDQKLAESKASKSWDDIGFAYVEMVSGNDLRVAKFFANRDPSDSFEKYHDLFDLLERHAYSANPPTVRLIERASRCRIKSRALFAAALRFSNQRVEYEKRMISALAVAPSIEACDKQLAMASALAASIAAVFGQTQEALAILDGTPIRAQSIHDFSSYWPTHRTIEVNLLAAGIRSALRRQPVFLIDIAPDELVKLVPKSTRLRGSKAFERFLTDKLKAPVYDGKRRRKQSRNFSEQTRSEYAEVLSSRVMPLVRYAQFVANIIQPPKGTSRIEAFEAAFTQLVSNVNEASNYPYRDGKAHIARTGFHTLFYLADALNILNPELAKRIVEWVADAPGISQPELSGVVARLSRIPQCHDAALLLAAQVDRRIQSDTDVSSRITAYGSLARAVWRVGLEESNVYFRRALDLAEAVGSDDFDRANHLLELAAHHKGAELSPEASHTFTRVLELNQNDDDRFPWIEYAKAMVPVAGRNTLAMLARLDDREVARLGLSLGPALTELVRQSKLSVEAAVALIGLAAPIETWTWKIVDFAEVCASRLPDKQHEWFFGLLLIEIDRNNQLSPNRDTMEQLQSLASKYLPASSLAKARIDGLLLRLGPKPKYEPAAPLQSDTVLANTYPVDLGDPDYIDRQILGVTPDRAGHRWPIRTLSEMARLAGSPADRLAFVRSVVEANEASLADKIRALDDHLVEWSSISVALREELPKLGMRLALKHAPELASSTTDAWASWRGLKQFFLVDRVALVEHVVLGLRGSSNNVKGDAWLALAAKLAAESSEMATAECLERFFHITREKLPVEVGDGPWVENFTAPTDELSLTAGFVWARLGHPDAAMRWRAAHAVRRLGRIGKFDIIEQLIERFDSGSNRPFGDTKLPFYAMHAQLWLLIALARVAMENARELSHCRAFFEKIAFSTEFPHVAMRNFAAAALRTISETLTDKERETLVSRLDVINQSPFPTITKQGHTDYHYVTRPDSSPRPQDVFHLDYDFGKYQVAGLCRTFSVPGWEIEDRIGAWVRRWNATIRSMDDCPRGGIDDRSWSSGYVPSRDRYGGYMAWHALLLVAGELLASRPVVEGHWSGDGWDSFVRDYGLSRHDGFWLSDLTDPFPLDLTQDKEMPMPASGDSSTPQEDFRLLAPFLGINGRQVAADWIPVSGRWLIGTSTTVTVQSILADARDAQSTVMTLLSDKPFHRWLPDDADEIDRNFGRSGHTVRQWIENKQHNERQLDRYDPYAAATALQRPTPSESIRRLLNLFQVDNSGREWRDGRSVVLRAEAWGAEGGRGEHAWEKSGHRILISTSALISHLKNTNQCIVLALKLQAYHKGKSTGRPGDTSAFTHRSLAVTVDGNGIALSPRHPSLQAKRALAKLSSDELWDFYPRFRAIAGLPNEWSKQ